MWWFERLFKVTQSTDVHEKADVRLLLNFVYVTDRPMYENIYYIYMSVVLTDQLDQNVKSRVSLDDHLELTMRALTKII